MLAGPRSPPSPRPRRRESRRRGRSSLWTAAPPPETRSADGQAGAGRVARAPARAALSRRSRPPPTPARASAARGRERRRSRSGGPRRAAHARAPQPSPQPPRRARSRTRACARPRPERAPAPSPRRREALVELGGELLGLVHERADRVEAGGPEGGIADVEPEPGGELRRRRRPAGAQQVEVRLDERLALVDVAPVDREREEIAERVRVDVARRLNEVRYVAPPDPVVVGDLHGVAEHPPLLGAPELADPLDGQLTLLAAAGVDRVLEAVHRDLAEDGRDRVVDPADEQVEQRAGVVLALLQPLERERLREDGRRLGERQRRAGVQEPEVLRERAVQAVAQLVRE